ncbi:MAG: 3'(2'),5'-bisphosphate nucleotidase CysQ [Campylobacterota bacterium]
MLDRINIGEIIAIAKEAGHAIMEVYEKDFIVEFKADQSPLTEADKKAHDIITKGIEALGLGLPILSEEGREIPYEERKTWEYFWMVDPLDGTKEFIKKNGEFTVNIALIHDGTPVLGVVYAPVLGEMYWAKQGFGAYKNGEKLPLFKTDTSKPLRIVASKSHLSAETKAYIDELSKTAGSIECISRGSSLKLCMVAEGSADIYPRLGPTMEWDTAAADAIVKESGKSVIEFRNGYPIFYNKQNLLNPSFIVKKT